MISHRDDIQNEKTGKKAQSTQLRMHFDMPSHRHKRDWERRQSSSPEGGAQGDVSHEDDIQQDEGGGEEPVHVAGVVDAAQVAIRVCNVNAASVCALHSRMYPVQATAPSRLSLHPALHKW